MGELEPAAIRSIRQDINEAENVGITSIAFGIVFEILSRFEGFPEAVQTGDRFVAGGAAIVAVGGFATSVALRWQHRTELRSSQNEQPPLA